MMLWIEGGGGKSGDLSASTSTGTSTSSIYTLRSRKVIRQHVPSGFPKRKRSRPGIFKPSKALLQEIHRLVEKKELKPFCCDILNLVTDDCHMLSSNSDSDSRFSEDLSPVQLAQFPLSTVTHRTRTPKVVDRSCSRLKENLQANLELYAAMAKLALEYYNFKQHTNLKFTEVTAASEDWDSDTVERIHINFIAASSDGDFQSLIFAELINDPLLHPDSSGYYVQGCCVIEKVDSAHFNKLCPSHEVQHPGRRYGYRIISGDVFKGYSFWDYHPVAYEKRPHPKFKPLPMPSAELAIYVASAKKALHYFNSKQQQQQLTTFKDAEATAGAHYMTEDDGTVVHINFMAQSMSGSQQGLFFAILSIPPFDVECDWDDWKEPFVNVEGCCRLNKADSGNPFGRDCKLCRIFNVGRVIHPSPRDGYIAAEGDDFADYDFMNMGSGIY
ncbi:uncharacterized protein LOC110729768 isoform X2 [Chenopodium quinoa]|uniref:uncharacterized protein LOC110729768 isoform X2 n=1 Tax=Chenopodium quinoa TaxID=63459 RepID=UPI000B78A04A|nr:uncharacterized protein LOC110729768 isoform X2 [Chenopodium quinoa]